MQPAQQVRKVLVVQQVRKVQLEVEQPDHKDPQDQRGLMVQMEMLEQQVQLDPKAQQVLPDQPDRKELLE